MLTLPDTDTALSEAANAANQTAQASGDVLVQQIAVALPWPEAPVWRSEIAYRNIGNSWIAAQVKDGAEPLTFENFNEQTTQSIVLDAPVVLNPVFIAKPWGQEIWFSGIEERGESTITQGTTTLPLSHYLALAPKRLVRRAIPLLLKILDPNPSHNSGCLYVETHNTKHEVYVVTAVDSNAWPNGEGAIRLGMQQSKRKDYASDAEFRSAFLQAVQRYERVRRTLDQTSGSESVSLHNEEKASRTDMESFTALKPLRVGDVVQVAPHIPHSLQHGVRVFEFQTPTYERNIISFNQKVLTQDHWDSEYAISNMSLAAPPEPVLEKLVDEPDLHIERIVDFDDFKAQRITLNNRSYTCEVNGGYLIVAVIKGELKAASSAGTVTLTAGGKQQAALMPASAVNPQLIANTAETVVLLAQPTAQAAGTIALKSRG